MGFAALKAARLITLPLAVVLLLFFRPLQLRLDARLPPQPLLVFGTLWSWRAGGWFMRLDRRARGARYAEQLQPRLEGLHDRLQEVGPPLPTAATVG
jgi:hypothetical protein